MKVNKATDTDLLIALLGRSIAQVHFDANQEMYKEGSEFYANEGTTKSSYMTGSIEHLETDIDETIGPQILDVAEKAYKRLCKEHFNR